MNTDAPNKRTFNEPKPTDTFLIQTDGRVVTYAELIELAGERPKSEDDLNYIMADQDAIPFRLDWPKDM